MNIKHFVVLASLAMSSFLQDMAVAVNPKPITVPEVSQWRGKDGAFLVANLKKVVYNDESISLVVDNFVKDFKHLRNRSLEVVRGKADNESVAFILKPKKKARLEEYEMSIDKKGVTIIAPTIEGLRWGAVTLLQLCEQSDSLPMGVITDSPVFGFRGFHIDAGRKFIPLDYLYQLVDVMSYYKMNKINLHLNDNGFKYYYDDDWDKTQAAFRLESDYFPGLTARDGAYSKTEFREFLNYAAGRGVEVIPEIDFPAHSLAFTRYRPSIGSTDAEYGRDHLDIMKGETYEFLDSLLSEYLEGPNPVFIGERFNIGTDEYSNRDSVVVEKFRYLTDRYIKFVQGYGKTPVVWGSLSHAKGVTPVRVDGVEMLLWSNDYSYPTEMRDLGYKLISIPDRTNYLVPAAGYYRDYLDNEAIYAGWTPAEVNGVKLDSVGSQLLGGMFALWNDHPTNGITVKDIHHRVMHSLPVYSAKTWSGDNVTLSYGDFVSVCSSLSEAPGVNYLAKHHRNKRCNVLDVAEVKPCSKMPVSEIGYDYTVEFDICGKNEAKGTALFSSDNAVFWMSNPITGTFGYSREDKLYTLRFDVRDGEKSHIKIEGNNLGVKFYVNGKLVDDMNIRRLSYNGGKNSIAEVRTLVFPLAESGSFLSKISNLKVKNYIE